MIFKKEPFFQGHDNFDQLVKIARVLGTEELTEYLGRFSLEEPHELGDLLGNFSKKPWTRFVNRENEGLVSAEAIDLLSSMLKYDHSERILPKEALEHEYFTPVKNSVGK